MMDYPCANFGHFGFSRLGFIMRTDKQTDRITESQTRMIASDTTTVSKIRADLS